MKMKKKSIWSGDLMLLKWPVLLLIVCIGGSAVLYGGAYQFKRQREIAVQLMQAERDQKMATVLRLEEETRLIVENNNRYKQLLTSGVVGEERRVALLESVAAFRTRYKLFPMKFAIGQQEKMALEVVGAEGGEEAQSAPFLMFSVIQFDLPLLHEGDLGRVLEELHKFGNGVFMVERCTVTARQRDTNQQTVKFEENLDANCTVLWLTLQVQDKAQVDGTGAEGEVPGAGV